MWMVMRTLPTVPLVDQPGWMHHNEIVIRHSLDANLHVQSMEDPKKDMSCLGLTQHLVGERTT
jgi:hypothetical protein